MPHLDASALTRDFDGVALLSAALGIPLPPAQTPSLVSDPAWQVLVVERDPLVRESLSAALHGRGYVVLEADTAERALSTLQGGQAVDVLLAELGTETGPGGPALAEEVRRRAPSVSVIYTSARPLGCAEQVPGSIVVAAPYRTERVLEAVHELTGRAARVRGERQIRSEPQLRLAA